MFTGSYFHLLDNKGRVSISPRYREILQERQDRLLILTNFDGYILSFPQSEWVKIEAKLSEQAIFRKDVRAFQRFLISGVQECHRSLSPGLRQTFPGSGPGGSGPLL
jgi:MraZ protein